MAGEEEAGAEDLFGDGLDTERLLKNFDTPSPNSISRGICKAAFRLSLPTAKIARMLVYIVPWSDPRIRG